MVSVRKVEAQKLVSTLKEELKKINEIQPPVWSKFVKSGVHKERPPEQEDFWFIRAAALMRRLYINGPIGVEKLRTFYGGRKQMGHRPAHFRKSSGNILRKILQQLEKAGFVEKVNKEGRKLTSKGIKFLNKASKEAGK